MRISQFDHSKFSEADDEDLYATKPQSSIHTDTTIHLSATPAQKPLQQLLPPGYLPQYAPLFPSSNRSSSIGALSTTSGSSSRHLSFRKMTTALIPGKLTFSNEVVTHADMREWLSRYDAISSQLDWNQDQKLANVALYLDGALKHWARNTTFNDWADFEAQLKEKVKAVQTPDMLEAK